MVVSRFKDQEAEIRLGEITPEFLSALELLGPTPFTATLSEPPIPGDATSAVR